MDFLFENLFVKEHAEGTIESDIPIEFSFSIRKGDQIIGTCCLQLESFLKNIEIRENEKNKFFFKPNQPKPNHKLLQMTSEKCKDCGEFIPFDRIEEHQNEVHKDLRPFECKECGKIFRLLESLTIHQRVHEEKPHKCNVERVMSVNALYNITLKKSTKDSINFSVKIVACVTAKKVTLRGMSMQFTKKFYTTVVIVGKLFQGWIILDVIVRLRMKAHYSTVMCVVKHFHVKIILNGTT